MSDLDFLVTLNNGISFSCNSKKTILYSALKAKVVLPYSCSNGQCGVCITTLLRGEITEIQEQIGLTSEDKLDKRILTCCCAPKSTIHIDAEDLSALHGIEVKTLPARVSNVTYLSDNIGEVKLRLPPTANFRFIEGQYLDVIWNSIRRSYSIASISSEKEITLLIKRFENGQMSDYWFNKIQSNDLLRIEGPKGTFFLRDAAKPLVFLATGTGIAPIKSILNSLEQDADYQQAHPITVYWGNRFTEEFVWQAPFSKLKVDFYNVLSRPVDDWSGETGYVQDIALARQQKMGDSVVYACGSNAMIKSAKQRFLASGLPENRFYSDAFVQSF
ncbi:oxidoreductase [Marinomonas primoryensis]|uniref:Oxidoreductase n=1 Tax=Marinomonas primoryensis TaxID=178399 RepID=A0A2Z4PVN8_9GAMM|nr:FAD-binding oxidoreductase [Marinomonas primoryensis]AWY01064.1 oxidoreductase [Marinomonas primoryensis]AWY02119.1 oxidoreductase [Marinomonas primoryensis]